MVVPLALRRTNHPRFFEQVVLDTGSEDLPLLLSKVEENILSEAARIVVSDGFCVAE